jgi:hypothetical protein
MRGGKILGAANDTAKLGHAHLFFFFLCFVVCCELRKHAISEMGLVVILALQGSRSMVSLRAQPRSGDKHIQAYQQVMQGYFQKVRTCKIHPHPLPRLSKTQILAQTPAGWAPQTKQKIIKAKDNRSIAKCHIKI